MAARPDLRRQLRGAPGVEAGRAPGDGGAGRGGGRLRRGEVAGMAGAEWEVGAACGSGRPAGRRRRKATLGGGGGGGSGGDRRANG